ncbi:MAG: histidine phosphatase family protein [Sphingobacteriia bacterium]|nr:histidine phosphatase family protein [Sphingobacteriia bacterium]
MKRADEDVKRELSTFLNSNKPFYFVRHAKTEWNKENRVMGHKDVQLNSTGITQAHLLGRMLQFQKLGIKYIYTSPLLRAKRTAEILSYYLKCEVIEVEDLKGTNSGIIEGQVYKDLQWKFNWEKGSKIEGAETFQNFRNRIVKAMNKIFENQEPVLIVSHGAVCRLLSELLYGKKQIASNAEFIKFPVSLVKTSSKMVSKL